jgi:hypothetical protein
VQVRHGKLARRDQKFATKKGKMMKKEGNAFTRSTNRRTFFKNGVVTAGAATLGAGLLRGAPFAFAQDEGDSGPGITRGDIAILTFLSALEQVEADLWIQYAELGGATNQGLSQIEVQHLQGHALTFGNARAYVAALQVLDMDMPQYIADNTDDEISHHQFLNNYLQLKGGKPIDLTRFAVLPPSPVTGVLQVPRLTNLQHLKVDTTWWTRYRSATLNPDLGDTNFEPAVPDLAKAPHTAIPVTSDDATLNGTIPTTHQQAIANTAGFHFGFIEQGGSSLYPSLAQRVTNAEVLRVLLSIGPSETMHFQVWHDKAGNAPSLTDGNLFFPTLDGSNDPNNILTTQPDIADSFQANLIMPEPTFFLNKNLGPVALIRPTETRNAAQGAVQSFVDDGLFFNPATGNNTAIVAKLMALAEEADAARREI